MNLVAINFESVPLGEPLPFALRAASGALLAQKGFVVSDAKALNDITGMGIQLCVDVDEAGDSYRAYVGRLQQMLMAETSLGELASVKMSAPAPAPAPATAVSVDTPVEVLVADARAKAVLDKYLPGIDQHPAYGQFKGMSLRQVAPYSEGQITDAMLTSIDAELKALPAE